MNASFGIADDATVVTSKYVTNDCMPILFVSHDYDADEGHIWQFHCGNDDFSMVNMKLVRLDTIIALDPKIIEVADLPIGFNARRSATNSQWMYERGG